MTEFNKKHESYSDLSKHGQLHIKPKLHGISLHSYFLVNTISTGMGVDVNVKILDSFATHVAPALGWLPNREGPVTGYLID